MYVREGSAESSSPPRVFGIFSPYEIVREVYVRLLKLGNEEATTTPEFRIALDTYFKTLPASYGLSINLERVEDVLQHRKLLLEAKDNPMKCIFGVRLSQNSWPKATGVVNQQTSTEGLAPADVSDKNQEIEQVFQFDDLATGAKKGSTNEEKGTLEAESSRRPSVLQVPLHELVFAALDRPKLLSQLSTMISEMGLTFRDAHAYSTTDGFSLYIFVVDGWLQGTLALYKEVEKGIEQIEAPSLGSSHSKALIDRALANAAQPDNVQIEGELLKIGKQFASGSSGDMHLGVYLGRSVAIKVLRSENLTKASEEFDRELALLREVEHRNVIRLIGWCTKRAQRCLVTEYMPLGSLYDFLHKKRCILTIPQIVKYALDICKGMEYLHGRNIIHRDLKSANLLLDRQNVVKVADFGIARFVNQGDVLTAEKGTYKWMAPEILNHQPYDQRADVYSFAIILWELVTGKVPYDTMTPLQAAMYVRQGGRPDFPTGAHRTLILLMVRCWQSNLDARPSFSAVKLELQQLLDEIKAAVARQAADAPRLAM